MLYSCELLDHHVKMSTEGFGTTHCFLKQIVTKPLNLSSSTSKQAVSTLSLSFFSPNCCAEKGSRPLFSQWSPRHKKGSYKILQCIFFQRIEHGCSSILMYRRLPSFQFSSSSEGINIVPSWSCGFGLFPLFLSWQRRRLHRSSCRPHMSHDCLSQAHVVQAT